MKKVTRLSGIAACSMMLLINCGDTKNEKTKNTPPKEMKRNTNMADKNTDPGLRYEVLKEGTGKAAQKGDRVTVHYTGWLDEGGKPGKKFDSSLDRKVPFVFTIGAGQVIKGWEEGVESMQVGEKRRLFIPAYLGYGRTGAGDVIPPDSNLIFDIELLKID